MLYFSHMNLTRSASHGIDKDATESGLPPVISVHCWMNFLLLGYSFLNFYIWRMAFPGNTLPDQRWQSLAERLESPEIIGNR